MNAIPAIQKIVRSLSALKPWSKPISYAVASLIFYFLIRTVLNNWNKIDWSKLDFQFIYLLISIILALLSYQVSIYSWKSMLAEMGVNAGYLQILRILGKSQLGKYLPGGIWMTASRVFLAEREGLSKSKVLLGTLVEQEYVFFTGLALSILLLGFRGSLLETDFTLFNLFFLLAAVVFLNPYSLNLLLNWGTKLFYAGQRDWKFSIKLYLKLIMGYSLSWMLHSLGFFFLIKSFYIIELAWLKKLVGIYIFSWIIGFIAIFAPGGLGVREGTMALLLQGMFPSGIAVLISLVCRIWNTLLELILAGLAFMTKARP